MKLLTSLALFIVTGSAFANPVIEYKNECKNSVVTVDEIVKNSHIKGHVKGLPTDALNKFKAVFYVKTNRWYVHPYTDTPNYGEGYSYSNLNLNGEFFIKTVRREVPSNKLAVVIVPKSYKISAQRWLLNPFLGIFGGVLKNKCTHTIISGNGDFFM